MSRAELIYNSAISPNQERRVTYSNYKDIVGNPNERLQNSSKETKPYTINFLNKEFIVLPNVFSPKYFDDSEWYATNLPINPGDKFLEIGSGTGTISISLLGRGASTGLATDINPDAVENTRLNIIKHQVNDKLEVRQSNVFSAVNENEKFDVIFWNIPFIYTEDEDEIPDLEKALFNPGYKSFDKFIREANDHLNADGKIYIAFSSTIGRMDLIEKITKEAGMKIKEIKQTTAWELEGSTEPIQGKPVVKLEIFEIFEE